MRSRRAWWMGAGACWWALTGVVCGAEPASAPATAAVPATQPSADQMIQAKVKEAIALLEAKKYAELAALLTSPAYTAKLKQSGSWEQWVAQFSDERGANLLKSLRGIQGQTPKIEIGDDEDGGRQRITYDVKDGNGEQIVFEPGAGGWFVGRIEPPRMH